METWLPDPFPDALLRAQRHPKLCTLHFDFCTLNSLQKHAQTPET